jgi:hypothetical protein
MHAVTIVDSALRALEVLGLSESCPTSLKANVSLSSRVEILANAIVISGF